MCSSVGPRDAVELRVGDAGAIPSTPGLPPVAYAPAKKIRSV
jgi:hypothetical protein